MKKLIVVAMIAAMAATTFAGPKNKNGDPIVKTGTIYAGEFYSLVNDANGYSYLQINKDMDAFSFNSDFKSIGNSGKVGVFKYEAGLEGQALKDYIAGYDAVDAKYMKKINDGEVVIGDVKAGDRVGFYLQRNNGDLVREWDFAEWNGGIYIGFDKNDNKQSSKDEWMSVGKVSYNTGTPLPGPLAVLLVGGLVVGFRKLRKRA